MAGPGEALLRSIPPSMDAGIVGQIDAALDRIRLEHGVAIPLAIESGSRAWGFPSPDSDYDCRFIFVRPLDDYLTPWQRRDVIEGPMNAELDVNGWDIGKALKLLLKGNAVVIEWLTSPIAYGVDTAFRSEFVAIATAVANRLLIGRHYLHLGERQRRTHFADEKAVPGKKIFYALRPAAALRWLRLHPESAIAPMHFPTLMAECEPPSDVTTTVSELVGRKAVSREMSTEPLAPHVSAFIDNEFAAAREMFEGPFVAADPAARLLAEQFYRRMVSRFGGGGD